MQILADGLVMGVICALLGCAFSILYRVGGFFNFGFGASYVAAGYTAHQVSVYELPAWSAVSLSLVAGTTVSLASTRWLYLPMRRTGSSPVGLIVASFGILLVFVEGSALLFGDYPIRLWGLPDPPRWYIAGALLATSQVSILLVGTAICAGLLALERITHTGALFRAVADDPDLATDLGLPVQKVWLYAASLGGLLASSCALLLTLEYPLKPTDGQHQLFLAFVATVIGGRTSMAGVAAAGILVGLLQQSGVYFFGSEVEDLLIYGLLFTVLLVLPTGLIGSRPMTSSVR